MREILFRGFTPDENGKDKVFVNGEWIKGQWVQGSYWELNKTTYCFKEDYERDPGNTEHYIVFDQMTDWGLPNRHLQADVLPETVGQYTGLIDKNGTKIFEGDIIKHYYDNTDKSMFDIGVILFDDKVCQFKRNSRVNTRYYNIHFECEYEVIGNIHDNPELLKGGEQ